ncbi:MAG: hypothetical protein ACRDZR_03650 [Acidimicrobiales bacterium]
MRHFFIDETKRAGYVIAAVSVAVPAATRGVVRGLVAPGRRRLHMVDERPRHRPIIIDTLLSCDIEAWIYNAGRAHRTEREARAACLRALVADLAALGGSTRLIIELDRTLGGADRSVLYQASRRSPRRGFDLHYDHRTSHEELLLGLPDVIAWCWARSAEWRRRIMPVVTRVRSV